MINPVDEVFIDLRTSCTKDEAVAKMLGWMKGNIRPKYIEVTEHGIPAEQLQHLHSLEGSLQDELLEQREAARRKLIEAAESDGDIGEAYEAVEKCDDLIRKAATYLLDIDDEISKGESSDLRIDRQATDSSGIIHITIKSLDQWARQYGISIIEASASNTENANALTQLEEQYEEEDNDLEQGLSKKSAESLYTTLAFLVEAYIAADKSSRRPDGSPNVLAIAENLESLATCASKQGTTIPGQGAQSIKKRITKALEIQRLNPNTK